MSAIDSIKKKLREVERLKGKAIEELLTKRNEIDSQLKELGHRRGRKPGKKRGRPKGSKNKKSGQA